MGRGLLANFGAKLISALSITADPPTHTMRVLNTFPHDGSAFTQGLCFDTASGTLLESTGLYGGSSVRRVELHNGRVLQLESLPRNQFGEGLTLHRGRCVQLLWHGGKGLVRDPSTFAVRHQFDLPAGVDQGWGLTHDNGDELFLSDGSPFIYVLDAATFALRRRLSVRVGSRPLRNINELQYIRGELWANLWGADRLAVIDAASGRVRRYVDCTALMSPAVRTACWEHRGSGIGPPVRWGRAPCHWRLRLPVCTPWSASRPPVSGCGPPPPASPASRHQERRQLSDPNEHVLNGIAHDPVRDRLFVTGKCWPRLFQISVHGEGQSWFAGDDEAEPGSGPSGGEEGPPPARDGKGLVWSW